MTYKSLINTLKTLDKKENGDELIDTLNVIANLMHELTADRETGASYRRTFTHDKLRIDVVYNERKG